MKYLTFEEVVKRLNMVFSDCDISLVQRIMVKDSKNRVETRPAWNICVAEKLDDWAELEEIKKPFDYGHREVWEL